MTITTLTVNQACSNSRRKKYMSIYTLLPNYTVTVCLVPHFPSMASFFFLQFVQRKGPSHGFEAGEKKGPEFTDKPSLGG